MTGALRFGRYELIQCIAAGGMGEVFLARQAGIHGFEKLTVVKVLLPQFVEDPEFTRMFLDEARIAAQLNHPNVAQVYDLGQTDGAYYIAMEHVHGESLAQVQRAEALRGCKVPRPLAVRMVADAAAGLDYAHHAADAQGQPLGVVHRDISPQNLLVRFDGAVKIIDFGIAKAAGRETRTQTGVLRGKIPYMSPEQASGEPLDLRSDVFALGVVLWELVTGRRLFKHETEVQTLAAVARCEVPRPSALDPEIDPRLEATVLRALAREPAQRFQTAGALRQELEEWLAHRGEAVTSAEVGAHLRTLFAARLAEERRSGRPFTRGQEIRSALFRLAPGTPSRRKTKGATGAWIAMLSGIATALAVVLGYVAMDRHDAVELRTPGLALPLLQVSTAPPGAEVTVDGRAAGKTPLLGIALQPGRTSNVGISLAGYTPVQRNVVGHGNHSLEITLQPVHPVDPVHPVHVVDPQAARKPAAEVARPGNAAGPAPSAKKGFPAFKARLLERVDDDIKRCRARELDDLVMPLKDVRWSVEQAETLQELMESERQLNLLEAGQ